MQFGVADRIRLLNILPREGDILTLRITQTLSKQLSFTEEEHALLQFVKGPENVTWNPDAQIVVDVEIGAVARSIIINAFKALDEAKKMNVDLLDIQDRLEAEAVAEPLIESAS